MQLPIANEHDMNTYALTCKYIIFSKGILENYPWPHVDTKIKNIITLQLYNDSNKITLLENIYDNC